ncbi:MAG: hypothetical protein SGBAC_010529 [Bacillariaceae sp.]
MQDIQDALPTEFEDVDVFDWLLNDDTWEPPSTAPFPEDLWLERYALALLFQERGGDDSTWTGSTNWKDATSVCDWAGITCNGDDFVKRLQLRDNGLEGEIPGAIGVLYDLEVLDLSENDFSGTSIPVELFELTNMVSLQIIDSGLTGPIDEAIGDMTVLEELKLQFNDLTGDIPELPELLAGETQHVACQLFENSNLDDPDDNAGDCELAPPGPAPLPPGPAPSGPPGPVPSGPPGPGPPSPSGPGGPMPPPPKGGPP